MSDPRREAGCAPTFASSAGPAEDDEDTAALLAAVSNDPRLLAPLQEQYAHWQTQAESDGVDPALATVIRLALDGLWMADLFGLAPPQGALRDQVFAALERLAARRTQRDHLVRVDRKSEALSWRGSI